MSKITDIEIVKVIIHVYWTAFDDGRILGKEKSPSLKDFKRAHSVVKNDGVKEIRKLIRKARS